MSWFDGAGSGQPADVVAMFDSDIPRLLAEIVQSGAMISVGSTSDGGAVGITVTLDGRWRREYFRESEPAVEWLQAACLAVAAEASTAPSGPKTRSRRQKA